MDPLDLSALSLDEQLSREWLAAREVQFPTKILGVWAADLRTPPGTAAGSPRG